MIKSERTESSPFDPYRILEIVFGTSYLLFIKTELSSTLNTKTLIESEEMDSSVKNLSDSELNNNDLELNINISLEFENLENIENTIKMDAKQFAEVLKNAGLFQKLIEPEEFNRKVEKDLLDFLKKFKEISEVNNWSNKWKVKLIGKYLKGNAKFWFEDLSETIY